MAEVKVYKLFASGTVSADGAASLDIQEDGQLCAALLDLTATAADALDDGGSAEISFSSTSGFTTNDTRASILGISRNQAFLTSGGGGVGGSVFMTFAPHGIPMAAGERIYLHLGVTGSGPTVRVRCWLYYCVTGPGSRSRVGRRAR